MGGVSILLFGVIASSGLRMMVDDKTDLSDKRNLMIASVILVIGIGGAVLHVGESFQVEGNSNEILKILLRHNEIFENK